MYDAVYVFAAGLTALDRSSTLKSVNLSCELEQPWHDGLSLYNYLTSVSPVYYENRERDIEKSMSVNPIVVFPP